MELSPEQRKGADWVLDHCIERYPGADDGTLRFLDEDSTRILFEVPHATLAVIAIRAMDRIDDVLGPQLGAANPHWQQWFIVNQTMRTTPSLQALFKVVHKVTRSIRDADDAVIAPVISRAADSRPFTTELARRVNDLLLSVRSRPESVRNPGPLRDAVLKLLEQLPLDHQETHEHSAELHFAIHGAFATTHMPPQPWICAAAIEIAAIPAGDRSSLMALIDVCSQAPSASAPTAKWTGAAARAVAELGGEAFHSLALRWFDIFDASPSNPDRWTREQRSIAQGLSNQSDLILRSFCWALIKFPSPESARALGRLAISAYRKVPGIGPRAVRVGNAAVYALGQMPGMDAVGQLAMLRVKVKFGTAQKGIEKALTAAAVRENLPREEIEELGIPTYGLTEVGKRTEQLGDFTVELLASGIGDTELRFIPNSGAKAGKVQKSVPAALKASHAEDLKDLKAAAKDIASMLPAQRDRLDSMFLDHKSWRFSTWRERYLDHPLVGILARRLIWRVSDREGNSSRSVTWLDSANALVTVDGIPHPIDADSAIVRLWHPIEVPTDEVLAWRRYFEDRQIRQPFKQAHREVYLLTDAERNTATYSNRFAAHVIRQHQFNALCGVRGWKNKLRLMVDDVYPPASRRIPAFNLRAEFWIEGAGDEYGRDTNESSVYLYLTTDQVRFYRIDAGQVRAHAGGGGYEAGWGQQAAPSLALDQVPPLVFSEILRDVDLFVGVGSIGNNPNWNDGGPDTRHRDYWNTFSFGELSETGNGRKDLLHRLIPRLTIANVCTFVGNSLRVQGKLRAYKIHLGSGNILMEPNDQYLCIVPSSRDESGTATHGVFLPFEGDRTLSIILSKAFMLAADDQIKDPSITRQINAPR